MRRASPRDRAIPHEPILKDDLELTMTGFITLILFAWSLLIILTQFGSNTPL